MSPIYDPQFPNWVPYMRTEPLKPEVLTEKTWTQEFTREEEIPFTSEGSILTIEHRYGGGYEHPFKVFILQTSSDSFTLLLQDLVKNDLQQMRVVSGVRIDLKDYLKPGVQFRIVASTSVDHIVRKIGKICL